MVVNNFIKQEIAELAATKSKSAAFKKVAPGLHRRGGSIYARVRLNGKLTWKSTQTNDLRDAKEWLNKWRKEEWMLQNGIEAKGVILHRKRVPVSELIDSYTSAGCPTRQMRQKSASTLLRETGCLKPLRMYFGHLPASGLTLADCDKYRDWRLSGGYLASDRKKMSRMKGGNRSVDLELITLANVFNLAVRRGNLDKNPLEGRSRYTHESQIRHCREVAPTPQELEQIVRWLRLRGEHDTADLVCFLAYSGLRIGEALPLEWGAIDWSQNFIHVHREKRGITPWVPILPEMALLLRSMQNRISSHLLFPSPFKSEVPRDDSAIRHRLTKACIALGLRHVTPHGLRSYFVTQARQSGIADAVIAMLIGDKTGPAIISQTYGDVRPDHLLKQAQQIKLTVATNRADIQSSNESSIELPDVAERLTMVQDAEKTSNLLHTNSLVIVGTTSAHSVKQS